MTNPAVMSATCPACGVRLKVKPRMLGIAARCPKCQEMITLAADSPKDDAPQPAAPDEKPPKKAAFDTGTLPATARQKDFAKSLGIAFDAQITRSEISELIDEALSEQRDAELKELYALRDDAQAAVARAREELLEEMADDPPVSTATPRQFINAMDDRGTGSVLITFNWDDVTSFDDLRGVTLQIGFSDDITSDDVMKILKLIVVQTEVQRGGKLG